MKTILGIESAPSPHWVGNGFPARSMFSYMSHGRELSPFLLLDYAGPHRFDASDTARGVGQHPHRGFETVTIVYQGEVEHRDSTGAGGRIGPGDVQWMTAASGILHEEFHSPGFTREGGTLEMVQLWVNLPARDKMSAPGYQTLLSADIPAVALPDGAGTVRVIAGAYDGHAGPARTFSPIEVWDVRMTAGHRAGFSMAPGHSTALVVLRGRLRVNGGPVAGEAQLVTLGIDGDTFTLEAMDDVTLLVLGGEPIDEPVVGHGPFVMNTRAEIRQAMLDFGSGRFGSLD